MSRCRCYDYACARGRSQVRKLSRERVQRCGIVAQRRGRRRDERTRPVAVDARLLARMRELDRLRLVRGRVDVVGDIPVDDQQRVCRSVVSEEGRARKIAADDGEPSMSDPVVTLPSVTRLKVDRISAAVSACADPHQTAQRAATDASPHANANLLTITLVLSLLGSAQRRGFALHRGAQKTPVPGQVGRGFLTFAIGSSARHLNPARAAIVNSLLAICPA